MTPLLTVLGVALVWSFVSGGLTAGNLLLGVLLGLLFLGVVQRDRAPSFPLRVVAVLRFVAVFLKELVLAGITIGRLALARSPRFHPHVIEVPLRVESDAAITLLSASITLLPGTVAMGTSEDRRFLYAHAIAEEDPRKSVESITRIEELILGFMR